MACDQFAARSIGPVGSLRRGFTLIELLVVISIIALLISILLPALANAREEGKIVNCGATQHQLGVALAISQNEYNGFYPMWDDGARSTVHNNIMVFASRSNRCFRSGSERHAQGGP